MKIMDKEYVILFLVNQVFLVISLQSNFAEKTFTIVGGEDRYVFSEMNKTVSVNSAIECARECIRMAPSIGGLCEGVNICGTSVDPTCELIFTPANGTGVVFIISRPGCLFYGRYNGNVVYSQQGAENNTSDYNGSTSTTPPSSQHGPSTNTMDGTVINTDNNTMNITVINLDNNTMNRTVINLDNNTINRTAYQSGTNDVDLWPAGPFTLLQPSSGCPDGWSTGYIQFEMQNPGTSYYSGNYMEGDVVDNLVPWHFCTKTSAEGAVDWPKGSYCILQHGGSCPNDFWSGQVGFDEEDSGNRTNRVRQGTLPDTNSAYPDVALEFCCRHDGIRNADVPLPITDPFYLFPSLNRGCPNVSNMTSVREFTYFDCEDFFNQNFVSGMTPLSVIYGNHRIDFCYYYQ